MKAFLSLQQRTELLKSHRIERDSKIHDRIKSALLSDYCWTYKAIARVLLFDQETVNSHVTNSLRDKDRRSRCRVVRGRPAL
jgi:hypothetical protein